LLVRYFTFVGHIIIPILGCCWRRFHVLYHSNVLSWMPRICYFHLDYPPSS